MKRKDYEKPTMKVVTLQQQTPLLAGSGSAAVGGTLGSSWNDGGIDAWGGSSIPGGGSGLGGWIDSGGDAW